MEIRKYEKYFHNNSNYKETIIQKLINAYD